VRVHPRLVRGRCNRLAGVGFNRCRSSLAPTTFGWQTALSWRLSAVSMA